MEFFKKNKEIFISAAITAAVLLFVYAIKHIYPFGPRNIAYFDMNQSFVPLYTRAWDVLHGKVHWLYDWYTGSGNAITGIISNFVISPFNLFFLFVKREHILESMSYFLILKLMFAAAAMTFYTKKAYSLSSWENIAAALIYAFSGYVIQYYTNIQFLDTVAFFPLFMYGFKLLAERDKPYMYLIMLVLILASGTYLALITLLFTLFYSFFYMYIITEKEKRKKFAACIGLYTLTALLVSMLIVLPSVLEWLRSSRLVENENSGYPEILKTLRGYFLGNAVFMIYGSEIGIAAVIVGIINKKRFNIKIPRKDIFNIIMFILLAVPLIAEPVNIMWHFGSYACFPCRYAFILTFMALELYAGFVSCGKERANNKIAVYICIFIFFAAVAQALVFSAKFMEYGIYDVKQYKYYALLFVLLLLMFTVMFLFTSRKVSAVMAVISGACMAVIMCIGFVSPLKNAEYDSIDTTSGMDMYIKESVALDSQMQFKNDNITRIKTVLPDLSPNFGLIMQRPTISSWTNEASYEYMDQMRRMGYGNINRKILCEGGTAFSDALLNVGAVVSRYPVNEELYEKTQTIGDFNIYKCKNVFPFGMLVSKNFFVTSFPSEGIKMQNLIYNNMTGSMENIFEDVKPYFDHKEKVQDDWCAYCYKIDVKGKKTIYARSDIDNTSLGYSFYANKEIIKLPYFDNPDGYIYPREHNNGFVELGTYKDETIDFLVMSNDDGLKKLEIGMMDNYRLEALINGYKNNHAENVSAEKNKLSMTANAPCECYMFLPIEYDMNWSAEVNGENADIIPVLNGAFMAVELPAGNCDIKMKYISKNFLIGGAMSLMGILLLLWTAERRREKLDWTNTKVLQNGAYICFDLAAVAALVLVYIIPFVSWVFFSVASLIK